MEEKVTISAPISNRAEYLPSYLNCILNQTYPKNLTNLYFLINNSQDDSYEILNKFKQKNNKLFAKITINTYNNNKIPTSLERMYRAFDSSVYEHLAYIRNLILESVNTKWLFSVDSDIMLTSNALETLIKSGKKVISGLVCNGHEFVKANPGTDPYRFTNIMYFNAYKKYTHFRKSKLNGKDTGILEVDVTGAVILMEKSIYKNCKYKYNSQGEDIPFCQDIQKLNEKLYCDTDVRLAHCMNLELLELYKRGEFEY